MSRRDLKISSKLLMLAGVCAASLTVSCSSSFDTSKGADDQARDYAGCQISGEASGPSDVSGIINGKTLKPNSRIALSTVMIYTRGAGSGGDGGTICTGLLIAKDLVLTAAHCVRYEPGLSVEERRSKTMVFASVDPVCAILGQKKMSIAFEASEVVVHPSYSNERKVNDMALIFLSRQVEAPMRPMRIALEPEAVAADSAVFVAGYGRTSDVHEQDKSDAVLRFTRLRPVEAAESFNLRGQMISNRFDGAFLLLRNDETSAGCSGDSGGPAMIQKNGLLTSVGVASFVYNKDFGAFSCHSRIAYTRISAYKDWLISNSRGRLR
jgi:secreted trypsin-like serine protease